MSSVEVYLGKENLEAVSRAGAPHAKRRSFYQVIGGYYQGCFSGFQDRHELLAALSAAGARVPKRRLTFSCPDSKGKANPVHEFLKRYKATGNLMVGESVPNVMGVCFIDEHLVMELFFLIRKSGGAVEID